MKKRTKLTKAKVLNAYKTIEEFREAIIDEVVRRDLSRFKEKVREMVRSATDENYRFRKFDNIETADIEKELLNPRRRTYIFCSKYTVKEIADAIFTRKKNKVGGYDAEM